jgi:hypothetical protein
MELLIEFAYCVYWFRTFNAAMDSRKVLLNRAWATAVVIALLLLAPHSQKSLPGFLASWLCLIEVFTVGMAFVGYDERLWPHKYDRCGRPGERRSEE